LLGIDTHDIDIAINTMTGEAFAQSLLDAGKIQSVGATIASNPEQSKHLATTRLKILGLEVDLVNLRSESYSKDSRIPSIVGHVLKASILVLIHLPQEFGTPQEDAKRRDLTINALFYNIHTREVEDFTGKVIIFNYQTVGYSTYSTGN
jgi:tRNA nucleotidyltransferase (CCA-adding enzyme)